MKRQSLSHYTDWSYRRERRFKRLAAKLKKLKMAKWRPSKGTTFLSARELARLHKVARRTIERAFEQGMDYVLIATGPYRQEKHTTEEVYNQWARRRYTSYGTSSKTIT